MTTPVPWADASSDADPVLRAVMRYAQNIQPSPRDAASLAAELARAELRVDARRPTPQSRLARLDAWSSRLRRPRVLTWAGALSLAAIVAVALAANLGLAPERHPVTAIAPEIVHRAMEPACPTSAAVSGSPLPAAVVSVSPASRTRPITSPSSADSTTELTLLTRARSELSAHPEQTLTLLASHQTRYPASIFAEERAALAVEALFRVGRIAQAEREFAAFVKRFPDSIYTPRLLAARPNP